MILLAACAAAPPPAVLVHPIGGTTTSSTTSSATPTTFSSTYTTPQPGSPRIDSIDLVELDDWIEVHTFTSAGTFPYYCSAHGSAMTGRVVVSARLNAVRLRRFVKQSPTIRRFYYEGLAPARRLLGNGS